MKIHQITFQPNGRHTKSLRLYMRGHWCKSIRYRPLREGRTNKIADIHEEDFAIIAMPVFAGRVPALAVERLRRIKSNHARCAIVAVYGNRTYDDALLEMQDVATEMGFRVVAAVSTVAEHSIARGCMPQDYPTLKTAGNWPLSELP